MHDVELVAAADVFVASLGGKQKEFGIAATYTDHVKMLVEVQSDAVRVCTPNGLHASVTLTTLAEDADVIVEKPLAMNEIDGQQMLDAIYKPVGRTKRNGD